MGGDRNDNDRGVGLRRYGQGRIIGIVRIEGHEYVVPQDEEDNHQGIVILRCTREAGEEASGETHSQLRKVSSRNVGGTLKGC